MKFPKTPFKILGEESSRFTRSRRPKKIADTVLVKQYNINEKWMKRGVILIDPTTIYIGPDVVLEKGTIIEPGCYLYGKTHIGPNNHIGPSSYLENVIVGEDNEITFSHLVDTVIGNRNQIGPYFRSRGNTKIGNDTKVGNFVEFKSVEFGDGSKSAHLTYLGDADIGENVNVGCGVITANYDGKEKHHTKIGKDAFVGSNSTLIAPVEVGANALVAAGSTINEDVPANALGIARERQTNKEGYRKPLVAQEATPEEIQENKMEEIPQEPQENSEDEAE